MEKQTIYSALLFASVAAVGNALFVFGQKKAAVAGHPFLFLIGASLVCLVLFSVTALLLPEPGMMSFVKRNTLWILLSGLGFYLTSLGFYFLYSRHGASYYVVYAVLSIVATSIVVGVVVFRESFNLYHLLAVITAIATVVLFTIGQTRK
jgi:drug/metabolite transporter (DMT)-like permease